MFSAKRSDQTYKSEMEEIGRLYELLTTLVNPACHWNSAKAIAQAELSEPDRLRAIAGVHEALARLVGRDEYDDKTSPFAVYLAGMEPVEIPEHLFIPLE